METRKITIVSTKTQSKKVIMSSAETLEELKRDLIRNDISYEDMTFYEGLSKTELKDNSSLLPHDVPFKGTITNELVFMLTNADKKIKSGISMSRNDLYEKIKVKNLQDACKKRFGKPYNSCKTESLESLLEDFDKKHTDTCDEYVKENQNNPESNDGTANMTIDDLTKVVSELIDVLYDSEYITDNEYDALNSHLKSTKEEDHQLETPYSDADIDDLFKFLG